MYIIRKQFNFSASHQLMGLPKEHPCSNLHGHNYTVVVELKSSVLNPVGFVFDYRGFEPVKTWLNEVFDHKHLNEVRCDFNPTAENLAFDIFKHLDRLIPYLFAVEVSETSKTSARYERD
jgi:6-pyruvoyltetrahydropterin/6-carboxytetrahydropterin synthase